VTRVRNWPGEQPGVWKAVTVKTLLQVCVSIVRYWLHTSVSKMSGLVTVWVVQLL